VLKEMVFWLNVFHIVFVVSFYKFVIVPQLAKAGIPFYITVSMSHTHAHSHRIQILFIGYGHYFRKCT